MLCKVQAPGVIMAIIDWPEEARPREKLLHHGAVALSDAELLAIFLRVGVTGCSAVDLARLLLQRFGSLQRLFQASIDELSAIKGMGPAKYVQLQAVLEMARRALEEPLAEVDCFESPQAVRRYLLSWLRGLQREVFVGLFLDSGHHLLVAEELFHGSLAQTAVYPREVARRALQVNAAALIVAHNHPSGRAEPSAADLMLTRQLQAALALLEVQLLDHFIVAGPDVVSLAERGGW